MPEYRLLTPEFAAAARGLCLEAIKEIFGFDYAPAWAWDLDALGGLQDPYTPQERGIFYVALQDQEVIGAAGVRAFSTLTDLPEVIVRRYPHPVLVGTLMRAYVRRDYRQRGIGGQLVDLCEEGARVLGYNCIYLHTHRSLGLDPVLFWLRRSYKLILKECDQFRTSHFEKTL